jgi:hypothetical protein
MARLRVEASSDVLSPSRLSLTFKSAGFEPVTLFGMEVGKQLSLPKVRRRGGRQGRRGGSEGASLGRTGWAELSQGVIVENGIEKVLAIAHVTHIISSLSSLPPSLPPIPLFIPARLPKLPKCRVDREHLRRRQDPHWPFPRWTGREGKRVCVCAGGRSGAVGGGEDGTLDSRLVVLAFQPPPSLLTPRGGSGKSRVSL